MAHAEVKHRISLGRALALAGRRRGQRLCPGDRRDHGDEGVCGRQVRAVHSVPVRQGPSLGAVSRRPDGCLYDVLVVARCHQGIEAGDHTPIVQLSFRYGMILFIASEVMFFVAWFWAYFSPALFPNSAIRSGAHRLHARRLAAQRNRDSRSVGCSAHQHAHSPDLGHGGHLGAPRDSERQSQGPHLGPGVDHSARHVVHVAAGFRVFALGLQVCWRRL